MFNISLSHAKSVLRDHQADLTSLHVTSLTLHVRKLVYNPKAQVYPNVKLTDYETFLINLH
jgi:hypothetical protein